MCFSKEKRFYINVKKPLKKNNSMVQISPHNNSSLTQNVAVDLSVVYLNLFSYCFVLF